jgi:DNA-binding NarL/FixJ family response regulator
MSSVFDYRGSYTPAPAAKVGRPPGKAKVPSASVTRFVDGKRVTEREVPDNPWGLSLTHAEVLEAICQLGSHEAVAELMKIRPNTVSNHTADIRQRMGVSSTILAAVKWTVWRQGEGKDCWGVEA